MDDSPSTQARLQGGVRLAGTLPEPHSWWRHDHAPEEYLSQASLHDVRLDPGSMYWQGQQTNLEYLLYLDANRLTWSFRQQAGLPTIGEHYGGWEAPDGQLRGHFVGQFLSLLVVSSLPFNEFSPIERGKNTVCMCSVAGHYLSASAHMWATTTPSGRR
jgi:hypothetical protein